MRDMVLSERDGNVRVEDEAAFRQKATDVLDFKDVDDGHVDLLVN